jgi:hypothetical protein
MLPFIFDLDDTLVRYSKGKINVPKQTFHCLCNLEASYYFS